MRDIYDHILTLTGWFGPSATIEGWFDQELTASGDAVDATAYPAGVRMVMSVGMAVATGTWIIETHMGAGWSAEGVRLRPRAVRIDATVRPSGVSMRSAVGRVIATGTATTFPVPMKSLKISTGTATARATRNLTWEQIMVLAEAA